MVIGGRWHWRAAEWVIDRLALPFEGWRLGHCRRAAESFALQCNVVASDWGALPG
jgi:hypothetical protein